MRSAQPLCGKCAEGLQGVTMTFSQSFIPIVLAYSTPQTKEKFQWRQQTRVYPIVRTIFFLIFYSITTLASRFSLS
jgi:hypothetical protein